MELIENKKLYYCKMGSSATGEIKRNTIEKRGKGKDLFNMYNEAFPKYY